VKATMTTVARLGALLVFLLWAPTVQGLDGFCWDMCAQEQECGAVCNLGGGTSTCGSEGYPCCSSESGFHADGARWETRWGGAACEEIGIGYWTTCRRCPSNGYQEQCTSGGCTECFAQHSTHRRTEPDSSVVRGDQPREGLRTRSLM